VKLLELKKRAARNGVDIIETKLIENSKTIKRLEKSFDRVLLDVPCSGSGVFRRNPDAKWKLNLDDLKRLNETQKQILDEKMTRLILLQLSSTKQFWENHWNEKMGINGNIKLTFLGVTVDQV
jgi:hypothetical protein